jgi:3,4-dihydroxyphenylacetate 2,3-dioxygenase
MKLTPPPNIVRSAYASLTVTDLQKARWFWVEMLGFLVTEEDDRTLYLRGYDELLPHNLILTSARQPSLQYLSYRVRESEDVELAQAFFEGEGCRTRWFPAGTTPGIGDAVRVEDPLGFTVEFFADASNAQRLHQRYDLRRGAEPARIDHFNIVVPSVLTAFEHYRSLGFGCSETIEGGSTLYAAWMYRKQTVHDVAFTSGRGPRFHHVGFFSHEAQNVLRTCDIFGSVHAEAHIERGPGRHGVSNALYVYLRDPDGHRVEIYTSDYYTGDPSHPTLRWDVSDPRRRDFWGNAVIPTWYSEATPVADLDGSIRPCHDPGQLTETVIGADGFVVAAS